MPVAVVTASAVGAAHRRKGLDSEDVAAWRTTSRGTALAIADGHSDPRCTRAARGARFAIEAAMEVFESSDDLVAQHLIDVWRTRVTADATADALPPETTSIPMAYGTTVLSAEITSAGLRLLQIGDGVATLAFPAGAIHPLPPDAHEGTQVTDSLAAPTAAKTARTALIELTALPALLCLSTDGIDAAYPTAHGLPDAVESLRSLAVEHGTASLQAHLDAWVHDAAETSGDDATVAIALITADGAPR